MDLKFQYLKTHQAILSFSIRLCLSQIHEEFIRLLNALKKFLTQISGTGSNLNYFMMQEFKFKNQVWIYEVQGGTQLIKE